MDQKDSNLSSLETKWISKASADQRAGRICHGNVFRLVTTEQYEIFMEFNEPEMKTCSLESTILRCKKVQRSEPRKFLEKAMDPPSPDQIIFGVAILEDLGGREDLVTEATLKKTVN